MVNHETQREIDKITQQEIDRIRKQSRIQSERWEKHVHDVYSGHHQSDHDSYSHLEKRVVELEEKLKLRHRVDALMQWWLIILTILFFLL